MFCGGVCYLQLYLSLMEAPGKGKLLAPHIAKLVMESGKQQIEVASSVAQVTPQVFFWDSVSSQLSHYHMSLIIHVFVPYFDYFLLLLLKDYFCHPATFLLVIGLSFSGVECVHPF